MKNCLLFQSLLCLFALTMADSSHAQAQSEQGLERATIDEIVVSARKREESLQDIPIAVSAFSSQKLESLGLDNLADLSNFSPGLDVQDQGATVPGRWISGIRFRGMNPTQLSPTFQVGALFVDGIYFLGGAQSIGFEDIERVEVIRGPQAAYFGRSTFGGAINYITKDPGRDFAGTLNMQFSPSYESNSYAVSGSVEGPLLEDRLFGRITASSRTKGAQYIATDGGKLGEETTQSLHASLLFEPTDRVRVKFRASFSEDDDGPAAGTAIPFRLVGSCPAGTPVEFLNTAGAPQSGVLTTAQHCGALPENYPITASTAFPTEPLPLAVYTGIPANQPQITDTLDVRAALVDNIFGSTLLANAPHQDHLGLYRKTERFSAAIDYSLTDALTLSGNVAYNRQEAISLRDSDFSDFPLIFVATPYQFRDQSGELRVQFQGERFRWLVGANYYTQDIEGIYSNAVEATYGFATDPLSRPHPLSNPAGNFDKVTTTGVFASIDYDIFPTFTATLEGRYQEDTIDRFAGTQLTGISQLPESLESEDFLPRAILSWNPGSELTVYGSYARGTLPGDINSRLDTLEPSDLEAAIALLGEIARVVPAEELDSYEVGLKQTLLNGTMQYALTAYYMDWINQKSTASVFLPIARTQTFTVVGNSEVKGVEFEGSWVARDNLQLDATFNYTDAKYTEFKLPGNGPFVGVSTIVGYNAKGNTLPRFPEFTGTLSATMMGKLSDEWDWSLRADAIFVGKSYIDEFNFAWVDPYQLVNLRFGMEKDPLSIELYATNLFDEAGWATGAGRFDLTTGPVELPLAPGVDPPAVVIIRAANVSPIDKRAIGIRIGYSF